MARHPLVWTGPLVALAGLVSYWKVFYRWPALSDVPWVNFAALGLAIGISVLALARAWRRGLGSRVVAGLGLICSLLLTGVLIAYCFVWSRNLPDPGSALEIGAEVPAVVLPDQNGRPVDLARLARDPLVLVFYRGFW
ncbi:MAG: hypothetical protein ACE5FG_10520 [Myxococcota bacterium]